MIIKYFICFIFFIVFTINVKAQEAQARFVFFKEMDLVETLKTIIDNDGFCENGFWIIQIIKSDEIMLTKGRTYFKIKNVSSVAENKSQYTTTIADNLVFIFTEKKFDYLFKKTKFKIDLDPLLDIEFVPFQNFSYWQILKENDSYSIGKKFIYKCN